MKRRDFFKKAAVGSAGLASIPILTDTLFAREGDEDEDRRTGFVFNCQSQAGTVEGVTPRLAPMFGCGTCNSRRAEGGGSYNIIDFASPVPKTILGAGKWRARRVLSFNPIGTYGILTAGILEVEVRLLQEIPSRTVIPATLRIACSILVAGLDAGEPEGITLTIPDYPFGEFKPLNPTVGITIFTRGEEDEDL